MPITINRHDEVDSQHWLDIVCEVEWRLGLCLHLVDSDTISELNQSQTVGEVNIENTLECTAVSADRGYPEQ